jgi:uncharacterized membrane protein YbhN (UPF0104 family)
MRTRTLYRWILTLLVFAGVTYLVLRSMNEIRSFRFDFKWSFLIAALVLELTAYLCRFRIWLGITSEMDIRIPVKESARCFFLSTLGKYVPGNLGLLLVRMEAYSRYPRRHIAVATIIEYIASIAAAALLVVIGLASAPVALPGWVRIASGAIGVLLILALNDRFLLKPLNALLQLAGRQSIERLPSWRSQSGFVLAQMFVGLLQGMAMLMVIRSLHPLDFRYFLAVTGAYYAAGLIGLAVVFAPSGIGVREGVLMLVLPSIIPRPIAIVSAVLMRLVATAGEVVLAGTFSLRGRRNRDRPG